MTSAATLSPAQRDPELLGQTVVVIGGSAGIGLETARSARAEGGRRHPHLPATPSASSTPRMSSAH